MLADMLKIFLLSLWIFTQTTHESFMSMECYPEKGVIKVFLKMNHDDFVFDYRFTINDDQNFNPSGKMDTTEMLIRKYIGNRLQIFADDKKLNGQLTNLESTKGELNMQLLYYYNNRVKRFNVKNTILNGTNKNHTTLLIFKYNDFEEGVKLTPEKTEQTFMIK